MTERAIIVAIVAPLILAGAAGLWLWRTIRRTHYTVPQAIWYFINLTVNKVLWRTTVSGPLPIGPDQGAVIVCNHRSGIDPLLIQMATERVVHWMVAGEYFDYRIMAACFRSLGSIPVSRRGVDTAATKQAIRLAKEGKLVGLFPEGRINTTDELLLPGRPGAALIALKAGVPVIPCYIEGAPYNGSALGPFLMTAHARVTLGQPIDLSSYFGRESDRAVLAELTKRFLKEIAQLAKNDTFEPKLAGKKWHPDDFNGSGESADEGSEAGDDSEPGDSEAAKGHSPARGPSANSNPSAAGNGSGPKTGSETGKGDDEPRKTAAEK
ncbi:MAG TPA: lysophospholipid acyltransferase family protein [Pirellulales bacterium]|jgi:1-acyl-sn-glycerol-3-phosphate acyltransferase|nr:lysophospholipid acyltransferase family protein [Pirellulales bacterium]